MVTTNHKSPTNNPASSMNPSSPPMTEIGQMSIDQMTLNMSSRTGPNALMRMTKTTIITISVIMIQFF